MITSTHIGSLVKTVVLALALATLATPVAGGGVDRGIGTPAAQPSTSYPDAFERAVARHMSEQVVLRDVDGYQPQLRSVPDAFERAVARGPQTALVRSVDGYQPQLHTGDGAQAAAGGGFEWSDAGAGAGVTLALLLLAGAAAARMRHERTGLSGS